MSFVLHSRLAADTHFVADWQLSRVLLMNDARYFWLVLVPRVVLASSAVTEITDLSAADRATLMEEAARAGAIIRHAGAPKLNIGAWGNLVPQLHLHVIGRAPGDPAWPGPVWGHSAPVPYPQIVLAERLALARSAASPS